MSAGIYQIMNKVNGKTYVGSSINIQGRWVRHCNNLRRKCHNNRFLQASWDKYGEENFEFSVLVNDVRSEDLLKLEQEYLDKNQVPNPSVYNLCPNARNSLGIKRSDETKARISAAKLGKPGHPMSPMFKAKILEAARLWHKGRKLSPEHRIKFITSRLGKHNSPEHNARISIAHKNKIVSAETRRRLRLANIGKTASPETRAKMSIARKGKPHTWKHWKDTEYWKLHCAVCGGGFEREARKERRRRKKGLRGPVCSNRCRSVLAAEVRRHGCACFK